MNQIEVDNKARKLRKKGRHKEADNLLMEFAKRTNTSVISLASMFSKPVKAKEGNELYLIRFKEGTDMIKELSGINVPVRWKNYLFIPIIGVELPITEASSTIEKIKNLKSFVSIKKALEFGQYSFLEI